jgi:hypothetical protein
MLRVQAASVEALGRPLGDVSAAHDAFDQWHPPDDAPRLKNKCSQRFDWCALERLPMHVHVMR